MLRNVYFLFLLLFFIFNDQKSLSLKEDKKNSNIEEIRVEYYKSKIYDPLLKKYTFKEESIIKGNEIENHGNYFKVYLRNNQINRIEEFFLNEKIEESHLIYEKNILKQSTHFYFFDPFFNGNQVIKHYNSSSNIKEMYMLDTSGNKKFTVTITYSQRGIDYLYRPVKDSKLVESILVQYNEYYHPFFISKFFNDVIHSKSFYSYDDQQRLTKKLVDYIQNRIKVSYQYEYIKQSIPFTIKKYENEHLVFEIFHDNLGREMVFKSYFPFTSEISRLIKSSYQENIQHKKYYNHLNNLMMEEKIDIKTNLKQEKIIYPLDSNSSKIHLAFQYENKKNSYVIENIYCLENNKKWLKEKREYLKKDILQYKEVFDEKGKLIDKEIYQYNQDQLLIKISHYSGEILETEIKYQYLPNQKLLLKKISNDGKVENLVFVYQYYLTGDLKQEKKFINQRLIEILNFDLKGNIIKIEKGSDEETINQIIKNIYNEKNQLLKQVVYNKIDQVERYILYHYNSYGFKIQEDTYDAKNQYLGSIKTYYDENLILVKEQFFNYKQEIMKTVLFDYTGKIVKEF